MKLSPNRWLGINFAKASQGGGFFGWIYKSFNSEKYNNTLKSLQSIKKSIDTDAYFANNRTYSLYLALMEDAAAATGQTMPAWKPTPCTVTEQEVEEQQIVAVEALYKAKDHVIVNDTSYGTDKETYGKFTVTAGNLNLNENILTVGEDCYITGGTVEGNVYQSGGYLK